MATLVLPFVGCSPPVANKAAEFHDTSDIWSLAFTPDGRFLAVNSPNDDNVRVWDWRNTPQIAQTLPQGGGGEINSRRFSAKGTFLASAHGRAQENKIVRVWSSSTGKIAGDIAEVKVGAHPLNHASLEFTPNEQALIRVQGGGSYVDGERTVTLDNVISYDTKTWRRTWSLNMDPTYTEALGVSPEGRYAAVAGLDRVVEGEQTYLQPRLLLVDLTNQRVKFSREILSFFCQAHFVAWTPDGRRIAIGGSAAESPHGDAVGLEILDSEAGKSIAKFVGKSNMVALDYSSDGKYMLVGWGNVAVEIWDSGHTKLVQRIPGHPTAARFSPDGRHLAIAESRDVTVWDIR
jgi:WD40 repeat protein